MADQNATIKRKNSDGTFDIVYPKTKASNVSGLATVATSGSYNDLSNKPCASDIGAQSIIPKTGASTKPVYFSAFITCLIYGAILDFWRSVIPLFNPEITAPGSMSMPLRIFLFAAEIVFSVTNILNCCKSAVFP